jgi:hypothetical protein
MFSWTKTRVVAVAAAGVFTAGAIVAMTTRHDTASRHDTALRGEMATADMAAADGSTAKSLAAGAGVNESAPVASAASPIAPPRVVKTGALTVEVRRGAFSRAFADVTRIAASHGGFVTASHVDRSRSTSGTLTLRVPAADFEATRNQLAGLGKVRTEEVTGEDVGGRIVDLDARLRSLQAQEGALRGIMGKAGTIGDTLQVQQQLTAVRTQIEQLTSEKARLDDAADLSTLTVELTEPGAAARAGDDSTGLAHSARLAVDGTVAVLGGTLVVLGYAVPAALILALGWGLARVGAAGWRRRRPVVA